MGGVGLCDFTISHNRNLDLLWVLEFERGTGFVESSDSPDHEMRNQSKILNKGNKLLWHHQSKVKKWSSISPKYSSRMVKHQWLYQNLHLWMCRVRLVKLASNTRVWQRGTTLSLDIWMLTCYVCVSLWFQKREWVDLWSTRV